MKASAEVDATIAELTKHGAEFCRTEQGRKHARVFFKWQGKMQFIICSVSGSDRRGPANARQTVRNFLGIVRPKKVGARRIVKERLRVDVAEAPKITLRADPFEKMRASYVSRMTADQLWSQWFGHHLRAVGHEPVTGAMR